MRTSSVKDGGLKFQRLDQSLPFFPAEAKDILKWAPILEELNYYGLKATGLKPGQYDILLDGKKVARHSDAELAAGVNLAAAVLEAGPIAEQVNAAWRALVAKNQYPPRSHLQRLPPQSGRIPGLARIEARGNRSQASGCHAEASG